MKNLLIFISHEKKFSLEHEVLTKIQIDNSLEMGWKPEDIILATDFDWEYRGVKSYVLGVGDYTSLDGNRSSKILVINQLFKEGMIKDRELYWFHDHDAFELELIRNPELGNNVAGFTDHGWSKTWNAGSFFFTGKSEGLFQLIYKAMIDRETNEQDALTYLWERRLFGCKMLNITYNLGMYHLQSNLRKADKPLLVAHFHPHKLKHMNLFRDLIPDRLGRIFNKYELR